MSTFPLTFSGTIEVKLLTGFEELGAKCKNGMNLLYHHGPRGYDGDRPKHTGGFCFIGSTPSSRSNKVGLKCPSARPFVHRKISSISVKLGIWIEVDE